MIVYRVEASFSIITPEGHRYTNLGPYTRRDKVRECYGGKPLHLTMSLANTPEPEEDGLKGQYGDGHYGFASLEDVAKWFAGCTCILSECGYYVVAYECPDKYVKIGGHQVQFRLDQSTPIRHYDRKEYLAEAKRLRYGNKNSDLHFTRVG